MNSLALQMKTSGQRPFHMPETLYYSTRHNKLKTQFSSSYFLQTEAMSPKKVIQQPKNH